MATTPTDHARTPRQATRLVSRLCGSIFCSLSPKLDLVPLYTPTETAGLTSLLDVGAVKGATAPAEHAVVVPIGHAWNAHIQGSPSEPKPEGAVPNA